jgi:hypothetical protein
VTNPFCLRIFSLFYSFSLLYFSLIAEYLNDIEDPRKLFFFFLLLILNYSHGVRFALNVGFLFFFFLLLMILLPWIPSGERKGEIIGRIHFWRLFFFSCRRHISQIKNNIILFQRSLTTSNEEDSEHFHLRFSHFF